MNAFLDVITRLVAAIVWAVFALFLLSLIFVF